MYYKNNLDELHQKNQARINSSAVYRSKEEIVGRCFNKTINAFLHQLVENKSARSWLNSYLCFDSSGKVEAAPRLSAACYSGITNVIKEGHDCIGVYVNPGADKECGQGKHWYGLGCTRDQSIRWYNYLANESPYASAFISKDGERMFDEHIAYFHMDVPSNLVVGAMTQLRQSWEYTTIVRSFDYFTQTLPHINKNFALYLGHIFNVDEYKGTIAYAPLGTNHTALHPNILGEDQVRNMVDSRLVNLNNHLSTRESYRGVVDIFGDVGCKPTYGTIIKRALRNKGKKGKLPERLFSANGRFYKPADVAGNPEVFTLKESLPIITQLNQELAR